MGSEKTERLALIAIFIVIGSLYTYGIRWGLPSNERRDLVLYPSERSPQLYQRLNEARKKLYEKMDSALPGTPYEEGYSSEETLLHSLSSFLVRTNDGDEKQIFVILSRLKLHPLNLDPGFYYYGGPYIAGIGIMLLFARFLGVIVLKPGISFYYQNPAEMASLYIWARAFSVFSALLCAGTFYKLARRLMPRAAAVTATLLFALAPINLYLGHVVKPHLLGTAFVLLGFHACLDLASVPALKNYLECGALLGLAVATTPTLWPCVFLMVIVHFMCGHKFMDKRLWLGGAFSIVIFFAMNPFIVFYPLRWLAAVRNASTAIYHPTFTWPGAKAIFCSVLWRGFGAGACLLSLFAAAPLVKSSKPFERCFLLFFALYIFLAIIQFGRCSQDGPFAARFMVPGFAVMALLAGFGLRSMAPRMPFLTIAAACAAVLFNIEQSTLAVENYRRDTPQTALGFVGGKWINAHIKPDSEIGVSRPLMTHWHPPFHFLGYRIVTIPEGDPIDPATAPEYFLLSANPTLNMKTDSPPVPRNNFSQLYELERAFVPKPTMPYTEYFSGANFPFWLYKRKQKPPAALPGPFNT
jgi:hypothetical protein